MTPMAAWAGRALVFAAALVAVSGAPAAGEEPMPPLPGAVAPSGAAAIRGEPPLPDVGQQAGAAGAVSGAPPDAELRKGRAGPLAEGEQGRGVASSGPDGAVAETDPPGGSRLLRALAERPGPGSPPAESGTPVFAAEGCPRALLRRLLAGAAGEEDALAALAIEREVLTLCRERQQIVTALFETEARLAALRAPAVPPPAAGAASPPAPAPAAEREKPAESVGDPAPSPLRRALAAASGSGKEAEPTLGWFSIIGSAGALRAGVTDGTGVWFVREGDPLPGGGAVAAIAGRPPSVRMNVPGKESGETLPFRAPPGGGR